jgi:hippurate hydrolase
VAVSTAAACGVKAEVEFESIYAVLDNVPQLAEAMKKAAAAVVGEAKTQWAANPQMGSEDFSFMLEKVPGAYCFLGGQAPHGATNLHNPSFDFDDRVLPTGAAIWVELAMERLAV